MDTSKLEPLDEIVSLNANDLQIEELERRLEMALVLPGLGTNTDCPCPKLTSCGTYCNEQT